MLRCTILLAALAMAIPPSPAPASRRPSFPIIPTASGPAAFESRDRHGVLRFTDQGIALSLIDRASRRVWGVRWSVDGARTTAPRGVGSCGPVNEFLADRTRVGLPSYSSIAYDDIRDGVDLEVETRPAGFKYTLRCDAGVDAASLRYRYDGVTTMEASSDGLRLAMTTGIGPMREDGLDVRQDGRRIAARFKEVRHEGGLAWSYGIELGAHDAHKPIEIDPTVTYSMLVGGSWVDGDGNIRTDSAGNAYFAMYCGSADMITVGGFDDTMDGAGDLWIAKLNADGTTAWSTYYGGSGTEQAPFLAIDASGSALVFSMTDSTDLPTVSPFQAAPGGGPWDCFVLKIASTGASVTWASYLAGSGLDNSSAGIVLDSAGNAYVAGFTESNNFPGLAAGFDSTKGGSQDGFVSKVTAAGALSWSSYVGGTANDDRCQGIAIDAGALYISGNTTTGFPVTAGAFDTTPNGAIDGYVMKINLAPLSVAWATYLGGSGDDSCTGIGIDSSGNVVVAGGTGSTDYPTLNALQPALIGLQDFNVTKLASNGASLVWSTYLGGSVQENARGLAVDSTGNIYIAGITNSTSWPGVSGGFQTVAGGGYDGVVAKVTPTGTLSWSSFLGGSGADFLLTVDVNATGLYLQGWTMSSNFPVTDGSSMQGFADVFVVKVALDPAPSSPILTVTPTDLTFTAVAGGAAPAAQAATVTNSGGGTLNWAASDDAAWLTASVTSGALGAGSSQSVNLSVNPAGLAAGLYIGTLAVTDGTTTTTVAAHLMVSAPPALLTATPSSLSFSATLGAANPAAQTVTIGNAGGSPLSWTATDDAAWLSIAPSSGSLGAGVTQNAAVTAAIAGLAPGTHTGTISIVDGTTTKTVTVQLVISATPGQLGVSPTDLSFTATQGAAAPASQDVILSNTGGSPLTWGTGQNGSWILVAPASGILAAGGSQAMTVGVDHSSLAPGDYVGSVLISDGTATVTVTVRLTVVAPAPPPPTTGGGSGGGKKGGCGGSAGSSGSIFVACAVLLALLALRK